MMCKKRCLQPCRHLSSVILVVELVFVWLDVNPVFLAVSINIFETFNAYYLNLELAASQTKDVDVLVALFPSQILLCPSFAVGFFQVF